MKNIEKRGEHRYRTAIQVKVACGRRTFDAETQDLSFRGLYIVADESLAQNQYVRIWIHLPKRSHPLEMGAKVTRVEALSSGKAGIGLQLYGNDRAHLDVWSGWIRQTISTLSDKNDKNDKNQTEKTKACVDAVLIKEFESDEELFLFYSYDLPSHSTAISTQTDLAIGNQVEIHLFTKSGKFTGKIFGRVDHVRREPGRHRASIELGPVPQDIRTKIWNNIS